MRTDGFGMLVDADSHDVLNRISVKSPSGQSAGWSPDGRVAVVTDENGVLFFDMDSGNQTRIDSPDHSTQSLDWLNEREIVLAPAGQPFVWLFDVRTGGRRQLIANHVGRPAVAARGQTLFGVIIAHNNGLFDISDGTVTASGTPVKVVSRFGVCRGGAGMAVCTSSKAAQTAESLQAIFEKLPQPFMAPISDIASHPIEDRVAMLFRNGDVSLLSSEGLIPHRRTAVPGTGYDAHIRWSPDGQRIALTTRESVQIWNPEAPESVREFHFPAYHLAWSPDSRLIALPLADLVLIDADTGRATKRLTIDRKGRTSGVTWSPDGRKVAAVTGANIDIWDTKSGNLLITIPCNSAMSACNPLIWSRDSRSVCCVSGDGVAHLFDAITGEPLGCHLLLAGDQWATVTPEGHWFASETLRPDLVVVAETAFGQRWYSPEEFQVGTGVNFEHRNSDSIRLLTGATGGVDKKN